MCLPVFAWTGPCLPAVPRPHLRSVAFSPCSCPFLRLDHVGLERLVMSCSLPLVCPLPVRSVAAGPYRTVVSTSVYIHLFALATVGVVSSEWPRWPRVTVRTLDVWQGLQRGWSPHGGIASREHLRHLHLAENDDAFRSCGLFLDVPSIEQCGRRIQSRKSTSEQHSRNLAGHPSTLLSTYVEQIPDRVSLSNCWDRRSLIHRLHSIPFSSAGRSSLLISSGILATQV